MGSWGHRSRPGLRCQENWACWATGRYKVSTYVDAQNSFGAMIRTDFICEVTHTSGDSYHLESLVMDE